MIDLETIAELARGDARVVELAREARQVLQGGAELTQRLLAVARRQHHETRIVDHNELVGATGALLRRSLGQGIDVRTRLTPERCQARVDSAQLESALLNLALNARDAMPDGGILTLATANRNISRPDPASGLVPSAYALVTVEDTGHGMAPGILARAFEPLFTTKDPEAGTGLGLSQVYGFVKQSGGHVALRSNVGRGTKVTLYLSVAGSAAAAPKLGAARDRTTVDLRARARPPR
jgi:signal transduction histidine kinase